MTTIKKIAYLSWWYIFGGIIMGLAWWLAGLIMYISIFGIPFGKVCLLVARFNFLPLDKEAVDKDELYGNESFGSDCLSLSWNQLWLLVAGWWLVLCHLVFAIVNFITIVGIPYGHRHLKLACISLSPIGKVITTKESAINARKKNTLQRMQKLRDELSA